MCVPCRHLAFSAGPSAEILTVCLVFWMKSMMLIRKHYKAKNQRDKEREREERREREREGEWQGEREGEKE